MIPSNAISYYDYNKSLKTLGLLCKQTRMIKGATQEELADIIGCTKQNISMFETGKNNNALILWWYIKNGLLEVCDKWGVK